MRSKYYRRHANRFKVLSEFVFFNTYICKYDFNIILMNQSIVLYIIGNGSSIVLVLITASYRTS